MEETQFNSSVRKFVTITKLSVLYEELNVHISNFTVHVWISLVLELLISKPI